MYSPFEHGRTSTGSASLGSAHHRFQRITAVDLEGAAHERVDAAVVGDDLAGLNRCR